MLNCWVEGLFPECVAKGSRLTLSGSGGRALFATRCFYVRNRPQPSATVRSRALRRCHWGKLLQVTMHGCVTCEFATLVHCDLRENDMSRKKRDAFRCTGAAFREIRSLRRSPIGIGVWRVVCLGSQECPTRVSRNHVPQECLTRVKSVPQECPIRVSHKSVPQECPTRVSHKSVVQEYPTRVSYKSVPQEFPTRVSHKSVPQECPARVSQMSVPQECPK